MSYKCLLYFYYYYYFISSLRTLWRLHILILLCTTSTKKAPSFFSNSPKHSKHFRVVAVQNETFRAILLFVIHRTEENKDQLYTIYIHIYIHICTEWSGYRPQQSAQWLATERIQINNWTTGAKYSLSCYMKFHPLRGNQTTTDTSLKIQKKYMYTRCHA